MRHLMLSSIVAMGLGLAGMTNTFAVTSAPANATLIGAANQTSLLHRAWWNRYGQWCSRRCSYRRCWVICR